MSSQYKKNTLNTVTIAILALLLAACTSTPDGEAPGPNADTGGYEISTGTENATATDNSELASAFENDSPDAAADSRVTGDLEFLNRAEGEVFDAEEFRKLVEAEERPSGIVLNFEGADIKRVIALVIGRIMNENYLIDPAVKGTVTLKTERPLNRDTVFYTLENVLDLYGARISRRKGHYRIYPKDKLGLSVLGYGGAEARTKLGYGYRIVPLSYISASELVTILESVSDEETVIRADERRNLVIIGGTSENVRNMLHAIDMFDVDWMRNTNVGLIKINYSNVTDVLDDLRKLLSLNQSEIEKGGVLTLDSIERLNSILVITRQFEYLQRIRDWTRKLDLPAQGAGSKLYVYPVKNSTAEELAALLSDLFSDSEDSDDILDEDDDLTGPGSIPVTLSPANPPGPDEYEVVSSDTSLEAGLDDENEVKDKPVAAKARIVAATDSNSLLISATPSQYSKIELALEKLDLPPLQVLMELTIMDVQLSGDFSYGIQWFLENGSPGDSDSAIIGDALNFPQTFSYSGVRDGGDLRAVLGLLASDGRVEVLSSPSVLVRNNHKASIRVGDQQPISTATLNDQGTVIATSVEYRDTGILLEIEPSITSSGTINVELTQEVIDVGDIDDATGQRTFLNRNLNTTVSVNNGETIILGGLIRSNQATTKSGIPGLRDIPFLGVLFGKTITSDVRTELVIMLSPSIIRNPEENNEVLREYRSKFKEIEF